jgi:hypothetical protein
MLLGLAVVLQIASATTYAEILDLGELTARSNRVVTGTVQEMDSFTRGSLIWTEVKVSVDQALVGPETRELSFELIGGTVDGLSLTVPGAPQFQAGQEVLVFVQGDELVGFGQGAFSLASTVASRGLGPLLPEGPDDFVILERLPNREDSNGCLRPKLWADHAEGWSLRAVANAVATEAELEMRSLELLAGMDYRFQVCGDQHLNDVEFYLVDEQDRVVASAGVIGREAVMEFRPDSTGSYRVGIRAGGLPEAAVGSSLSISVAYR